MKIIIMRHGRPDISQDEVVSGADFGTWIEAYNSVELDLKVPPPDELFSVVKNSKATICSALIRSVDSAKILEIHNYQSDDYFNEAELPYFDVFHLKFRAKVWLIFFRILWLLGFSGKVESFSSMKLRAETCSDKLNQLAIEHGTVLFVGHGILNRTISKNLIKSGWYESVKSKKGYWSFSVYEYKD